MTSSTSLVLNVLVLLVSVTCFDLAASSSDPAAHACSTVCEDEIAGADQCEIGRACDYSSMSEDDFAECSQPCWNRASVCQRMCRRAFMRTLDRCTRRCPEEAGYSCVWDCFTMRMMRRKARYNSRATQPTESSP